MSLPTVPYPRNQGNLQFTSGLLVDSSTITDAGWTTVSTGFLKPIRILKFLSRSDGDVLVRYVDSGNFQDVIPTDSFQSINIQANHDGHGAGTDSLKLAANQLIQFRAPTGVTLSGNVYVIGYA